MLPTPSHGDAVSAIARLIRALPGDFSLTLADVGSAGGLNRRWKPFRPVLSAVLFDPRERAASGALGRGMTRVLPVALGAARSEATLYVTALPNMSSLLKPERDLERWRKKDRHAQVTATEPLALDSLDSLAAADGFEVHVLKIDTQGSELDVLKGATGVLARSAIAAEVEVSFFSRYEGQALFADIQAFMNDHGFELIDLHRLKRYRARNPLGVGNVGLGAGQRAGRIAYGDAIFLRREPEIRARARGDGGTSLLRALVALVAYGKPDLAARLFGEARDTLDAAVAGRVESALRSLGSVRFGIGRLHAALDWLARKA